MPRPRERATDADIALALKTIMRPGAGRSAAQSGEARGILMRDLALLKLPTPEVEFYFHPTRRWRFDLAWPDLMIAVEIEGLVYSNAGDNQLKGRHVSVTGFKKDIDKYGEAFAMGWTVARCTSKDARDGTMAGWLERRLSKDAPRARR